MTRTTEKTNTETPISNRLRKRRKPVMENSNADHSLAQKQAIPSSPKRKKVETCSLPKLSTTIQQKQQIGPVKISAENEELSIKKYSPKCNATKTKQKSSPSSLSKCLEASKSKHPRKVNEMGVENEEGKRNKLQKRKKPDIQISKLDHWLTQKGVISPLPNKKIKAWPLPVLSTNNKITQDEKFVKTIEESNTETPISNRLRKRRKPVMENSNADHSLAQKQVIPSSPKRKKVETCSLPKLSITIQQKQQIGPVKILAENKELSSKKYSPKCNATKTKQKSSSPSSLSKCLEASKSKHPRKVNEMGVENEEEGKRNKLQKRKKPDIQISRLDHWLIQKGVISPLPNKKIKACSLPILSTNNKITQDEKFVKTIEESNTENRISKRIQKRKKCDMENSNADQLFAQKEIIPLSSKKKKIKTCTSPRLSTIMQEIQCSEPVKTPDENCQNNVMSNKKYSQKHTTKNKQKSLSKCLEACKSKHPKKHIKIGVEDNEEGKRKKFHNRKNPDVQISELDHQLTLKGVIPLLPHNEKIDDCSLSKLFRNMQEKPSEPEKIRVKNFVKNKVMSKKEYSPKLNNTKNKHKSVSATSSSKYLEASKTKQPRKVSRLVTTKTSNKMCPPKSEGKEKNQCTLKSFIIKNNTKTFKRNDSFESVDLPTFSNVTKKKHLKSSKVKEQKASFQKYGVILPTIEEILKDMEDLEYRRNKIKSFKPISEDSLELPFSNEILQKPAREKGLDCKHLTLDQLTSAFNLNASFLSDIINEKISNNRHQRYFNKNLKVLTMTSNDLTYNTTTIVFSYEQIDHLMSLLKKQFDPDDTKTKYFFQVLLPELCLQIFMKTYGMNLEQAVKYLGEMPLID